MWTVAFTVKKASALPVQETAADGMGLAIGISALSAALAVGLASLGAGLAIKTTGTAAVSLLSEKPEEFFKAFLVVALGEALAVYGLIIGILLWTKIPIMVI
ncbi:MAG: ATP synthase subunit C [Promethearchaeota archaeon]